MHANVVDPERAYLLVVDLQETYRDKLFDWERTVERAVVLIRAARLLELPVLFTESMRPGTAKIVNEWLSDRA